MLFLYFRYILLYIQEIKEQEHEYINDINYLHCMEFTILSIINVLVQVYTKDIDTILGFLDIYNLYDIIFVYTFKYL